MREIVIRSEKEAFAVLERALRNELGDQPFHLKFENWPILEIKLKGKGYDSTITADMAAALVEVQRAVNRTYARLVKNSSDARTLTDGEKLDLQFKAKVKRGSSVIEVNLGDFAEKLATSVTANMTPGMIAIVVLGTAVSGASLLAYKAFLRSRSDDKQMEQAERTKISLSQEETRRLEIVANAIGRAPALAHVAEDFDQARNQIVGATGDASSLSVNSLEIDSATARAIASTRRAESVETQLNGSYLILTTDVRQPEQIKMRVQRVGDGKEFVASFHDQSLDRGQITLLQAAEWNRTQVYLSINARVLRGEVTVATVISVTPQPPQTRSNPRPRPRPR